MAGVQQKTRYGNQPPGTVFVERKTHKESWKGEESVKERFVIAEDKMVAFIDGECGPELLYLRPNNRFGAAYKRKAGASGTWVGMMNGVLFVDRGVGFGLSEEGWPQNSLCMLHLTSLCDPT